VRSDTERPKGGSKISRLLSIGVVMAAGERVLRPLGLVLVALGVVSAQEVEEALEEQERSGERLGEILIRLGYASRIAIMDALAEQAGLLLEPERGFGSGLRDEIERRHRDSRGGLETLGTRPGATCVDHADGRRHAGSLSEFLIEQAGTADAPPLVLRGEGAATDDLSAAFLATVERARCYVASRREGLSAPRPR
jgi:hypothetical protein